MFGFSSPISTPATVTPTMDSCPIYTLPTELIREIGGQLSSPSLKHLSSSSRGLRRALLPLIVKGISITSMDKLKTLANGSGDMVDLIRHLNITLNTEFYDAWTHDEGALLARIMSKSANLQSLTFQASNSPYDTPWNRLNVGDATLRGISLGLETLEGDHLPTFERLTHLELQTISTQSLEILLSRSPNLGSLTVTLPDGLSASEVEPLLTALRYVPRLKQLTVSIAEWRPSWDTAGVDVAEVLNSVATQCPLLEELDLRTRSYDMIDGILAPKCVEVGSLEFEDFVPILPEFSNLKVLRLPLQIPNGDATEPSTRLARQLPSLDTISWMRCVAFQGRVDEYRIRRSAPASEDVIVTRLDAAEAPEAPTPTAPAHPPRRGLSLFDSLFENFVSSEKPGIVSDVAVSFTAVMVVSSMIFSPLLAIVGF